MKYKYRKYKAYKYNERFVVEEYLEIQVDGKYSEKHLGYVFFGLTSRKLAESIASELNLAVDKFLLDNEL